jgi:tRNA A37 threonylcarbamoyladenosine dehydratase
MSQWLQRHTSATVQLGIAATVGALAATTIIFTATAVHRRRATEELKASIPEISREHHAIPLTEYGAPVRPSISNKEDERSAQIAARARKGDYDEELILEQLARNRVFLKDEGLAKLRGAFVVVVGLGGVGSHCVAALVRSGVGRVRVVDFDQVTLSSLNRHALATLADVGTPKVHCVRKRLEQVCPWARIDCRNELLGSQSMETLLSAWDYEVKDDEDRVDPDWVVDAIDNIDSKVALLHYCALRGIKVVSAMGAGCKGDPTRIQVGDISTSVEDPLSKSTRRRLRAMGVKDGIPVVFSTEKPGPGKAQLLPIADEEVERGNVDKLGVLPEFRVRILPVLGTMPAVFGYTVANHVICSVAGYPLDYRIGDKGREKMYDGILSSLQGLEERLVRSSTPASTSDSQQDAAVGLRIPIGRDDVAYLVEEVFRGKSVVSGLGNRLALVRWRKPTEGYQVDPTYLDQGQKMIKLALTDLVLMTKEEAQTHETKVLKGNLAPEDVYEPDVLSVVKKRHDEERAYERYR